MELAFSPEDRCFQAEVRDWLAETLPKEVRDRSDRGLHSDKAEITAWQRILNDKGWLVPGWPLEYGGTGWSLTQKYLFNKEYFLSGAPQVTPFGVSMVGPVIYTFGSPAQKERFLPRILNSDDWWCQGYSEPGAGSDLASLKTRAIRDGGDYVVNGQKIWTSYAHKADWMFCLVRTSTEGKRQEGISFLLIDMNTPGIEIRPITALDHEKSLNEVFFTDVRVPAENLVGEENKGWTYAKFLLGHERGIIARVARSQYQLGRLKRIAAAEGLLNDPDFRLRIAEVELDLMALEAFELRCLSEEEGGRKLMAQPSMLKIRGSEIAQQIKALTVEALGPYGAVLESDAAMAARNAPIGPTYRHGALGDHLYQRAASIYGGTNEVQRNIIAKLELG